ncbi:hypothetical protein [Vulgatibacter sp.]|uniref:hypothetical protein n=1 Tax=Vulgatibacter sp. TaxID=1971226 RepID=UPI00356A578F
MGKAWAGEGCDALAERLGTECGFSRADRDEKLLATCDRALSARIRAGIALAQVEGSCSSPGAAPAATRYRYRFHVRYGGRRARDRKPTRKVNVS